MATPPLRVNGLQLPDGSSLSVTGTGYGAIRYNNSLTRLEQSVNGGAWAAFGGGGGDMLLAGTQTVTGAKTFSAATLLVNNAGNTFATTLASAATAARTLTLPDITDTVATLTASQTLSNKILSSGSLNGTFGGNWTQLLTTSSSSVSLSATSASLFTMQGPSTTQVNLAPTYAQLYGPGSSYVSAYGTYVIVNGLFQLASATTSPSAAGQMAWDGTNFKGSYNGTTWTNFSAGGGATFPLVDSTADNYASTIVPRITLENTTAATSGQGQNSPALSLKGRLYDTASETVEHRIYVDATTATQVGRTVVEAYYNGTDEGELASFAWVASGFGKVNVGPASSGAYIRNGAGGGLVLGAGSTDQIFLAQGTSFAPNSAYLLNSGSSSLPWSTSYTRHIAGVSAAIPYIVAGTGAGTGPTVTVSSGSTDIAGTITVVVAATGSASATVVTVTFNTAYGSAPRVSIEAANAAAAALTGTAQVFALQSAVTTTTFTINSNTTGLAVGTYAWNYQVIQ